MSAPKVPSDVSGYVQALREYHLRLAEWLGIDPSIAYGMREKTERISVCGSIEQADVWWKSDERPHEVEATDERIPMAIQVESDGTNMIFTNGVHLNPLATREMRAVVGERPEMFTPEQALMLDGLRWRAEHGEGS